MADVFISYSRRDADFVRQLHARLSEAGRDCWVDWEDIPPSAAWLSEIYGAIEAADAFIFVITPDSLASTVCGQELEHALKHNKRLVPLLRRPADGQDVPEPLAALNWIYCRETDSFDEAFGRLLAALDTDLAYVRAHTRLLVRAVEWETRALNNSYLLRGDDLSEAESWLAGSGGKNPAPSDLHTRYIFRSRQAANARQRVTIGSLAGGLVLALVLAAFALVQWNNANLSQATAVAEADSRATQQRIAEDNAAAAQAAEGTALAEADSRATQERIALDNAGTAVAAQATAVEEANVRATAQAVAEMQARIAQSGQLAAQALNQINEHLDMALLLSAEAYRTYNTFEARRSLLTTVAERPELVMYLREHASDAPVSAVAISRDGRALASADEDGTIILWDAATGQRRWRAVDHIFQITRLAFTPDGQTLLATDTRENLTLWDVNTGQRIAWPHVGEALDGALAADFSSDGRFKASASLPNPNPAVILWDVLSGQRLAALTGHTDLMDDVAFSPDGRWLASVAEDRTLRLWDVETHQSVGDPWQTETQNWPTDLTWRPDGKVLAVAYIGYGLMLWDAENRREIARREIDTSSPETIEQLAFTPDGATLIAGLNTGRIMRLNAETLEQVGSALAGHTGKVNALAVSADGRRLVSGGEDGLVIVWSLVKRPAFGRTLDYSLEAGTPRNITFNGDELILLQCAEDCLNRVVSRWDAATGQPKGEPLAFSNDQFRAFRMAFNSDGSALASGGMDNQVMLVDLAAGADIHEPLRGHGDYATAFAFSLDGKLLASSSLDNTILLWDTATGEPKGEIALETQVFSVDPGGFWSLAFSPDGRLLAAGDGNGTIHVWEVSGGALLDEYNAHEFAIVDAVAFSPDGRLLASGGGNYQITLWDMQRHQRVGQPLVGHTNSVNALAFSPDGEILASAGNDGQIFLWDVATGQPYGPPLAGHTFLAVHLAFSPDGRWLASSGPREVILWNMTAEGWRAAACDRARLNFTPVEWERFFPGQDYRPSCPESPAGLPEVLARGESLARDGDKNGAGRLFETAMNWASQTDDSRSLAQVCYRGALNGFASLVLPACERAVQMSPEAGVPYHRRGIARALLGDYAGAAEDFRVMLEWLKTWNDSFPESERGVYEALSPGILGWITALKAGQNPFDADTLAALREQG
jgi:WD40 repeat protein